MVEVWICQHWAAIDPFLVNDVSSLNHFKWVREAEQLPRAQDLVITKMNNLLL